MDCCTPSAPSSAGRTIIFDSRAPGVCLACFLQCHMAFGACQRSPNRGPLPRGCRAYQRRTVDVVNRAVASWQAIFGGSVPPLSWGGGSCPDLARLVKKFLASKVSTDEAAQMGFQSIKKLLPDSCRCMESGMLDELVERLGRAPRVLPSGYLSFVKREVSRLFPKGWDASYEGYCLSTAPPLTSCCEAGVADGGVLSALGYGQSDYLDRVLHGRGGRLCPRYSGKLLVVQSAGKPRALSKFPAEALFLKPLHKTIYGSLSKRPWLLRGPPSREALRRAGFSEGGGVLVSGDYRSATDNLPIEVMELALSVMLENAVFVPRSVAELALRACRPILFSESESLEVRVGQMMGSLLSFPFLCLQNYLAFRWACRSAGVRGRVPVLINGDDILFQTAVPGFPERWLGAVAAVGLEVEETKTSVELEFGSLNSTLLRWVDGALTPVWSPRFGMLRPAEHPGSLGKSFLDFLRGAPEAYRFRAGRVWFEWHLGALRSAGVALPDLGFRGLLAKRLAGLFHLLHFPRAEFPSYFAKHGVSMCGDFVSRVDSSMLSEEELRQASMEVAAQKWSIGFVPASRVSGALRYCLERSASKGRRFDYPSAELLAFFWADPLEFRFRLRNLGYGEESASRRELTKAFLAPVPVSTEVLVPTSCLDQWLPDLGRGPLPPYSALPGLFDLGTLCG
nr:MAG: putative RNA-dependent RNA polymerase [Botourmiaviridae sp.]